MDWTVTAGERLPELHADLRCRRQAALLISATSPRRHGPWNGHKLNRLWFNVDIVGDYCGHSVRMSDGSVVCT
jgi:hypothetical protein